MARILVIDDERAARDLLIGLLGRSGHDVTAAASVADALAHAASYPLDLVITDMFMPEEDGFDAMQQFRQRFPGVAIVAMSGGGQLGNNDVLEMARFLGVATVEKPISMTSLTEVVDMVLDLAEPKAKKPFLPAALAPSAEVTQMSARLAATPMLVETLDALPVIVLLLNRQRQAVFANRPALRRFGFDSVREIVGKRPGELLSCAHAGDDACGTTDYCRYCGAGRALAGALRDQAAEQECRIMSERAGGELDLRVAARPFSVGADRLLLLAITDIADEKRRAALEATFFHDVLNTAGGIRGLTQLVQDAPAEEVPLMHQALDSLSETLVDEIEMQRSLMQAEHGELSPAPVPLRAQEVLEAEAAGSTVHLRASRAGGAVRFEVRNAGVMPESAQKQVFQRSFSTKGAARGLGTYSMRLLCERYLGGRVWFESDAEFGTRFMAEVPVSPVIPLP